MEETATPPLRAPASPTSTPSFEGRAAWRTAIAGTIGLTFGSSVLTVFAFGTFRLLLDAGIPPRVANLVPAAIYNHCHERTSFVADWFADRLAQPSWTST